MLRALLVPLCVAMLAVLGLSRSPAQATKYWKNSAVTPGNWSSDNNWSSNSANGGDIGGEPALNEPVNIVNNDGTARTITYNVAAPSLGLLTINLTNGVGAATSTLLLPSNNLITNGIVVGGYTGFGSNNAIDGSGTINQSAGTVTTNAGVGDLVLGWGAGSTGTYTLSGGAFVNNLNEYVGLSGTGTFNHSGGSNTINASATGFFSVGRNTSGSGTYNLSGTGALVANTNEYIGYTGRGTFNQTGGTNTVGGVAINRDLYLGYNANSNGSYTLGGGSLIVNGSETLGFFGTGSFSQSGGTHSVSTVLLFGEVPDDAAGGSGDYTLSGGELTVGGYESIASSPNSVGTFSQTGGTHTLGTPAIGGALYLATWPEVSTGPESRASYSLTSGSLTVYGREQVGRYGSATFTQSGGTHTIVGSSDFPSAELSLATFVGATGTYSLSGSGVLAVAGDVYVGGWFDYGTGGGGTGVMNISGGTATMTGTMKIWNTPGTAVNLAGTTLSVGSLDTDGNASRFNWTSGALNVTNSSLTIGSAGPLGTSLTLDFDKPLTVSGTTTIDPFRALTLSGGSFTTGSLVNNGRFNFISGTQEITGGTSSGLSGLAIPTNGEFRASGVQSLRITGAAGSTITATGNLTLGDAAAVNGFGTQGTLQVGANSVTLLDANDAVFDSLALVTLGNAGNPGTLNAANGLTLDFGGNFTGFGAISTSNNVAKPLINNGHITGNSVAQPITLTGYVKGVGTFDNVNFTGTFSPGLSPTSLLVGNIALSPTSTLVMELGGTTPGSQHDQIQASGTMALGGTLDVDLLGGFIPANGNEFVLATYALHSGQFSALDLPPLASNLAWSLDYGATDVTLSVTSTRLPGDIDEDGDVDRRDAALFAPHLGLASGSIWTTGDFNGDGMTTLADLALQQANFGAVLPSPVAATAAVPEPATWALMLGALCLLGLGTVGRRRTPAAVPAYRLLPCHVPRVVLFAVLAITSPHLGGSASGSTTWTNAGLGNWFIGSNWSAGVADSDDDAFIPAGTALVSSLGAFSRDLRLGHTGGNGSLLISNGGTLDSLRNFLADGSGSNVSATVSGGTSFWSHFDLFVGVRGTASLTVSNGGLVHSIIGSGNIGFYTGSAGSVNVTGANSAWIADGNIHVGGPGTAADGFNGVGTLQIASGGLIQASNLIIFDTGSVQVNNGSSTVSGLTVSGLSGYALGSPHGPLTVGNTASGRMVVQTRGTVWSSLGTIGANSGTVGSVLVDGANATWTNTDQVVVGLNGTGTLEVRNGGHLTSVRGFAGAGAFSTGIITVRDPGSTWTASGSFFIGNSGSGLLQVLNGGVASTTGNSHLGITVGAAGDVNVSDAGSTLNVAVLLNIGGDSAGARGSGSVRIADGGIVNVGAATNLYTNGRLDLVNATTFTGDLNSFGGLIRTFDDTTLANAVQLNTGGVFVVNFTPGSNSTFSGNIDGPGGLTKSGISGFTGLGTLTLTGANTYLGSTTINAGTLLVDGSITSATTVNTGATLGGSGTVGAVTVKNGGIVSPGNSPGLLTAAAMTFDSGAPTLAIELGGTTPGTQYDQVTVVNSASLAGTLDVTTIDGFAPTLPGESFIIVTAGALSGMFDEVLGRPSPSLPGLFWTVTYTSTSAILSTSALRGDIDLDGDVDRTDAALFTPHLGTTSGAIWTTGDFDGDSMTTIHDLALQQANFGAVLPSPVAATAAVPEPSNIVLLLAGMIAIGAFRRLHNVRISPFEPETRSKK